MNRFVSLLLVAFCLAAVSLVQPAHAQQAKWYKGLAYFDHNNSQSSQPGTAITAAINNGYFDAGVTPSTKTQSASIGGNTSAYSNGTTQSTIVTADVTFGDPVVTQ